MGVKHKFVSGKADGADATEVRPSNWNDEHKADFTDGLVKADADGYLVKATAGTDYLTNPMTASGDIIYGGTSGSATRLPKGTDGQVLKLAGGLPSWSASSGGGSIEYVSTVDASAGAALVDIEWVNDGSSILILCDQMTVTNAAQMYVKFKRNGSYENATGCSRLEITNTTWSNTINFPEYLTTASLSTTNIYTMSMHIRSPMAGTLNRIVETSISASGSLKALNSTHTILDTYDITGVRLSVYNGNTAGKFYVYKFKRGA